MERSHYLRISNSYYNQGLLKAQERNLSACILCLKRALYFNKANINARNLLGLAYYETGEAAEALSQWVISLNIKPDNNAAQRYISRVRDKSGELDKLGDDIKKYNQALMNLNSGNKDLAIMLLARIADFAPNYVRANLLLSLLYIDNEEYSNAERYLKNVLEVDVQNPAALKYMQAIKEATAANKKKKQEKKRLKNTYSHRSISDDEVIIPKGYNDSIGWQTVLNIGIGLLIGAASIFFIYMPANKARMTDEHNKELAVVSEKLNAANLKIDEITKSSDGLQAELDKLKESMNTADEATTDKISQYQLLAGMIDAYKSGNYAQAANLYAMINEEKLLDVDDGSGVSAKAIYDEVSNYMRSEGDNLLMSLGDTEYNSRNYEAAIQYYDKSIKLNTNNPMALFKKALSYKQLGDVQNANTFFEEVISKYPNSEAAVSAKLERGY